MRKIARFYVDNFFNGSFALALTVSVIIAVLFIILICSVVENIRRKKYNTDLKILALELQKKVYCDSLTGIYNRDYFYNATHKMLSQNIEKKYVLICMDIEKFKVINDRFGEHTGDMVLKDIAQFFKEYVNGEGTYCRQEADHFTICIPAGDMNIDILIEAMDDRLERHNLNCKIVSYFGIYYINDIKLPVIKMYDRANIALKTVKGSFLNRYAVYNEHLLEIINQEQRILNAVDKAFVNDEFCIYLQPIYSMSNKRIISAEALVRWIDSEKGMIEPAKFIPLFEKNGIIARLDRLVFVKVCETLRMWLDLGKPYVPISVNLSRADFQKDGFTEEIFETIREFRLDPHMISFEITESLCVEDPERVLAAMEELQRKGFNILMDDFGSGYSSLNMLKNFPVDIIKIDMKFLEDLSESTRTKSILTSVVRMAEWMNMKVIAEGVETTYHAKFLQSIACDVIQGFLFSKPVEVSEFEKILEDNGSLALYIKAEKTIKDNIDEIWSSKTIVDFIFETVVSAVEICEFDGETVETLRVNEGYYKLMQTTPKALFESGRVGEKDGFSKEDWLKIKQAYKDAKEKSCTQKIEVERTLPDGKKIWLETNIGYVCESGGNSVYILAGNDTSWKHRK